MVIVQDNTFVWNTGGLRADLGLVRDGGWDQLNDEAQMERRASQRKIEWLCTHVTQSEPTVVFLEEVTGSLREATTGLRRTFIRLGYETLMLPGAGGGAGTELSRANGIFAAVRRGMQRVFRRWCLEGCVEVLESTDQAHAGARQGSQKLRLHAQASPGRPGGGRRTF